MITITIKCKKHPKYKAIRPPRCACEPCQDIYDHKIGFKQIAIEAPARGFVMRVLP